MCEVKARFLDALPSKKNTTRCPYPIIYSFEILPIRQCLPQKSGEHFENSAQEDVKLCPIKVLLFGTAFDYLELIRYSCRSVKPKTNPVIWLTQRWGGAFSGVWVHARATAAVSGITALIV